MRFASGGFAFFGLAFQGPCIRAMNDKDKRAVATMKEVMRGLERLAGLVDLVPRPLLGLIVAMVLVMFTIEVVILLFDAIAWALNSAAAAIGG